MALPLQPTKLRFTKAYLFGRNPLSGVGTVTSVDVAGGASGLTFTGGPITTNGTITLSGGVLDTAYGGTGAANAFLAGVLKVANGGTGLATLPVGHVPFGQGTSPFASDANLYWDNGNKGLLVNSGTSAATTSIGVAKTYGATGLAGYGAYIQATRSAADANALAGVWAQASASHTSGTVNAATAVQTYVNISGAGGTTSFSQGVSLSGQIAASATLADYRGVFINDLSGSGTLTAQYGLFIASLTKATTNWALYSAGATPSMHVGNFGIGTAGTPGVPLVVNKNTSTPPAAVSGALLQLTSPDATVNRLEMNSFTGANALVVFRGIGGTGASPSATQSGYELGGTSAAGRGATGYTGIKAKHSFIAEGNWTDAAQGVYQEWQTTPFGSITTLPKMRLDGTTLWVGNPPTTSPVLEANMSTGKLNGVVYPEAYGAKADALFNTAGSITSGSQALTLSGGGGSFSASDVGKTIMVAGAGAANGVLITTIAGYTSGTQVTLTASASTTCTNGKVIWGTDNTTIFGTAFTAAGSNGKVQLRPGYYLLNGVVSFSLGHFCLSGAGPQMTTIYQISPTSETFKWGILEADQQIKDLSIEGPGPGFCSGSSSGISWAAGAGPYYNSLISNVKIRDLNYGIYVPSAPANALELNLRDVEIFSVNTTGVHSTGAEALYWDRGLLLNEYTPLTGLGITAATTTLSGSGFSSNWIGKRIVIAGAGPAAAGLQTTVVSVASASSLTVANAAGTTVAGAAGVLGANTQNGIYIGGTGGYGLTNVDIVGCRYGMQIAPNAVTCSYGWAYNLELDSSWDTGLYLNPTGGGLIHSHVFTNCWFASSGLWAGTTYSGSGQLTGIYANGAASSCKQISFQGCRIVNNGNHGANLSGMKQLLFNGCIVDGNSAITTATWAGIRIDTAETVSVVGNTFGHQLFQVGTKDIYSLITTNNVTGTLNISGNNYRDYNTAGTPVNNTSALAGAALVNANNCYA